jgi:hypothetical protein
LANPKNPAYNKHLYLDNNRAVSREIQSSLRTIRYIATKPESTTGVCFSAQNYSGGNSTLDVRQ